MTTEDDFHRHLDEHPDDHHARLVFADFLQERGDPRAEGYRALGGLQRRAHTPSNPLNFPYGWTHDQNIHPNTMKQTSPGNELPHDWWTLISTDDGDHPGQTYTGWWKELWKTRRGAEDAAALAFSKLPPQRREELLGQQSEKLSRRTYSRRTGRRY